VYSAIFVQIWALPVISLRPCGYRDEKTANADGCGRGSIHVHIFYVNSVHILCYILRTDLDGMSGCLQSSR
jgi:hypothetical protein